MRLFFLEVALHAPIFLGEELEARDKKKHRSRSAAAKEAEAATCLAIAHLAVPCRQPPITFLTVRFMHSRLVLWNKHHQAHPVSERKSRIHSNGPRPNGQKPTPPVVYVYVKWGSK
jgi:hypothetical protein